LSEDERIWLNRYHKQVREVLKSLVSADLQDFLEELTREI
jgi:hypothetical protein